MTQPVPQYTVKVTTEYADGTQVQAEHDTTIEFESQCEAILDDLDLTVANGKLTGNPEITAINIVTPSTARRWTK